jgi:hypothetical protein
MGLRRAARRAGSTAATVLQDILTIAIYFAVAAPGGRGLRRKVR